VAVPVGLALGDPRGVSLGPVVDVVAGTDNAPRSPPLSVNGSLTNPAAPKPTPTEAAANSAHRTPRATRLSTCLILPPPGITPG
jgi:hypothetical protein